MSTAITEPGWYRAGPKGLELVAGLDDAPDDIRELVKVELATGVTEDPLFD